MIVEKLKETGALEKVEPCLHAVPRSQRGGAILEPRLTTQWYCDVKALAARAIEKVKSGEMGFIPKLWENTFFSWLENIQPWCISRQLWWGHQIPAYYGKDGKLAYVGKNPPTGLARDEDVLDTWFSSGLWPMATLGWPDESAPDFKKYFPNSVLVTGFDIIFFWVARMAMFSLYFTGKAPFGKVVLHGLVTDERGVKMSKTKGNVINPLDFIGEFGADPLRFAICLAANQNRTNPFGKANVENAKKFLTKLLNAVAFWEINGIAGAPEKFDAARSAPAADWIIGRMNGAVAAAEAGMEAYRYDEYANNIYHFVWDDFCSAFIEAAKPELAGANRGAILSAAHEALKGMLKMLQPVTPFIAAELWERLGFGKEVDLIREPFAAQITLGKANIANAEKFQLELETKLSAANRDEEIAKSRAELAATEKRIGSLSKQLSNKGFTENAKPDVLAEYRNALAEAEAKKKLLEEKIG
jgi:valyl-tRNA synthetase